ncbi:hypothetical protein COHA_004266 [Chlorella ohadii]|uniref:Protein kinase domain-containing protein n=1 Tax=Chlorella ohadii TaxID=2649997 RepID=A0AAD5DXE6_9CHLO|nr:hypothetical protein COHA_004266 [Chlorella ohadii]
MQQPSPFVADQPAAAGALGMQEGAVEEAGTPPALAPSRSVQNSDAVLMDRCKQAVEQCRSDLADLRTAVKAANSHREKCAELLGAATEAVVALEDMLYDSNIDLPRERALQTLARRVQTAMDQGEAVVKVYGHMSGIAKLASKVCSPGTPLKFDESTRELTSLAKQARLARQQPPAARMPSSPSNLAGVGSLVVPLGSQPPLTGSAARTASTALAEDAPSSDAGTQSTLPPSASGLTASGVIGGAAAAAAGAAQAGPAAAQAAADGAQGLAAQGSGEQQSSAGAAAAGAAAQVAAPSSSSQLVVGSRLVPEEAMQAARIRKGSRGQAITALVHVPPGEEQPPGHLGFLWYYLSRGIFSGGLYRRDLSKQEDWELRDARHNPDVHCMCYDDVNQLVWTGHRNGGIRVWSASKDEAVLELYRAFHSSVSAITTDERGCCWAASDKGKVRCFQLEAVGADGIHEGYRVAKLGELNTVSEGVPVDYGSADVVNGMVTHPLAREPAHYGPVRSMAAAMGRVWTCGGSSAFASFKEWTQQGVLLGSQSMRLTGLANDIVLVSQVVGVQENQRVSVNAPGMSIGSFSVGGVASLATASRMTVNQVVDVDMPWQLLTVHDSGAIQVWGIVDKALVPLVRIGDRVAPALRLIVCESLGLLITAHNDGKLRLRALPHPQAPERITVVYQDEQLHKVTDATLPCAQIDTSKTGLAQAVGNLLVGVITASNYATIKHFPTAELRRTVEEHNAEHPERSIKIWPAINVVEGQYPFWRLSPFELSSYLEDIKRHQAELMTLNSLEYQSSLGVGSRPEHESEGGGAERSVFAGETNKWQIEWPELRTIRIIGEGAFGKVWLGRWQETDVAIKQLGSLSALGVDTGSLQHDSSGGIKLDKEVQRALDKEVNLLKEMRHPNIILFMGVVLEPAAVVTEYCARGSLYDLLKAARQNAGLAKALDWPKRISMALDAAKGMLYLHGHKPPIIHRDLKSPNLLVEKNWRVKVTDFNLSRVSRTDNVASVQSMVANNPRWQPPEVILRQQYGKESDVYAFGLILWELLTWELPFVEMSTLQARYLYFRLPFD